MTRKLVLMLLMVTVTAVMVQAQSKKAESVRIKLGNKTVLVKGKKFNEISYKFGSTETKSVAYYFVDAKRKALVISEVEFEMDKGKGTAVKVEIYTCPLNRINRTDKEYGSYNIEMTDEAAGEGRYWRLTLVSLGQGADNLYFTKERVNEDVSEISKVNNVTINVANKQMADRWLREFTK